MQQRQLQPRGRHSGLWLERQEQKRRLVEDLVSERPVRTCCPSTMTPYVIIATFCLACGCSHVENARLDMIFNLFVLPRPNWGIEQDESFEPMARKFSFTVNATIGELQLGVRPHISGFGVFCM